MQKNINQRGQQAGEDIDQPHQQAGGEIYQSGQKAEKDIKQYNQWSGGDIYQTGQQAPNGTVYLAHTKVKNQKVTKWIKKHSDICRKSGETLDICYIVNRLMELEERS